MGQSIKLQHFSFTELIAEITPPPPTNTRNTAEDSRPDISWADMDGTLITRGTETQMHIPDNIALPRNPCKAIPN